MLDITPNIAINDDEFTMVAVRSQGAGGQNVNKVSTAVQIRFDIHQSSLPGWVKARLLGISDQRLSKAGVWVCKVQEARTQERNRQIALQRLQAFVRQGTFIPKRRVPTKPSKAAKKARVDSKTRRGQIKQRRGRVSDY
ncbi:alternative ribosome rescue aminoacyl-tRNA hydrolase ArfB [Aurantivibrio plasticivorans]